MSAYLEGLKCPVCGETVHLKVTLSGGSQGSYFDPPEAPDVEYDIKDAEFDCSCLDGIRTYAPKISRNIMKRVKSEPLFPDSELVMVVEEHKKDSSGRFLYEKVNPLEEAYFEALDMLTDNCPYHYEPDEPYDPDYPY